MLSCVEIFRAIPSTTKNVQKHFLIIKKYISLHLVIPAQGEFEMWHPGWEVVFFSPGYRIPSYNVGILQVIFFWSQIISQSLFVTISKILRLLISPIAFSGAKKVILAIFLNFIVNKKRNIFKVKITLLITINHWMPYQFYNTETSLVHKCFILKIRYNIKQ